MRICRGGAGHAGCERIHRPHPPLGPPIEDILPIAVWPGFKQLPTFVAFRFQQVTAAIDATLTDPQSALAPSSSSGSPTLFFAS